MLVGESKTLSLSLRNDGLVRLYLDPLLPSDEFTLVDVDTGGIVLNAVDTMEVAVRFTPGETGNREGRLSFAKSRCTGVVLTGRGETNTCVIEPDTLAFGRVELGGVASRSFTVWNLGTLALAGNVSLTCAEFAVVEGEGPFSLATGESLRVTVEHRPEASGRKGCVVELGTEGPCREVACTAWPTQVWRVAVDGTGVAETVQRGIELAASGDTVLVGPGRYYEDVDFLGKDVVVRSEWGPAETVLDGTGQDSSVVVIKRGETRAAVLEGFTITGGKGTKEANRTYRDGGGVWIDASSPTIRGNHIVGNHLDGKYGWGGAMRIADPYGSIQSPLIEGNLFEGNSGQSNGGAVAVGSSNVVLRGNVFRGNRAGADGGAVWLYSGEGHVRVLENRFWGNEAFDHGGAIEAYHTEDAGPFTIEGNLFVRNVAHGIEAPEDSGTGGAISARHMRGWIRFITLVENVGTGKTDRTGGGMLLDGIDQGELVVALNLLAGNTGGGIFCRSEPDVGDLDLTDNLFWSNHPVEVHSRAGCATGWEAWNIVQDPQFCNPEGGDYRVAASSPALQGEEVIGAFDTPGCGPR